MTRSKPAEGGGVGRKENILKVFCFEGTRMRVSTSPLYSVTAQLSMLGVTAAQMTMLRDGSSAACCIECGLQLFRLTAEKSSHSSLVSCKMRSLFRFTFDWNSSSGTKLFFATHHRERALPTRRQQHEHQTSYRFV